MTSNEVCYSQQEINGMINELIRQVKSSGIDYKYVVGIREGGLHVSRPLAEALGVPHYSVWISYYEDTEEDGLQSEDGFEWKPGGLVADDLIDCGKTMWCFDFNIGPCDKAVLFWNGKHNLNPPKFYVKEKPEGWIVFPWEVEDE